MTEGTARRRWPASAVAGLLAIAALCGCVRTVAGHAAWTGGENPRRQPASSSGTPGIETTLPEHIPPNAFACFPGPPVGGIGTVAQAHDSAAPRLTIAIPDGWSSEPGQRDLALTLTGPGGMSGSVIIAATTLDPGRAFSDYAATLAHSKSGYHVETLGAKFCGYSSQKLVGTFRNPTGVTEFADRLTHIWTNTGDYLVAIHMEGPENTPGFGAAKTVLLQDFAVVIP